VQLSHIGEDEDENFSEASFSKYKAESHQPVNAAMEKKEESAIRTISPMDLNIELKNLLNYDYFHQKMSKIKSKRSQSIEIS
jgi:hypothetical protein